MSQVQESSLRVILAGRTGLDATLRKDPSIELLRVKTPVELIGELSQPIDEQSPPDAVVVIGPEVEPMVDAADMVGALRMISPKVRIFVSTTGQPSQNGFDGVVRPDSTAEGLRDLLRRLPPIINAGTPASSLGKSVARPITAVPQSAVVLDGGPPGSVPPGFIISNTMPAAIRPFGSSGSPGAGPVPLPSVVVTPAATERVVPRPVNPAVSRSFQPAQAAPEFSHAQPSLTRGVVSDLLGDPLSLDLHSTGCESVQGPIDVSLRSTVDDRDVLAAVTAGRNPLPAAVALLRLRAGVPDIAFISSSDQSAKSPVSGAPVLLGGQTVGHLVSNQARPEQLADGATWLGGWLLLRDSHAQACRGSLTDGLTGVYNRRFFDRFLASAMQHALAARHDLSVLLLDVDNFKTFNDRYGHAAGDQVLIETARLLRSLVRAEDRVCRLGGDEFAVVFFEPKGPREPGSAHPGDATRAAARFRAAIESHRFPRLGSDAVGKLTISGGLATFPWHGLTPEALLQAADKSLYEAKKQGKNAIVIG